MDAYVVEKLSLPMKWEKFQVTKLHEIDLPLENCITGSFGFILLLLLFVGFFVVLIFFFVLHYLRIFKGFVFNILS